MFHHHHQRGPFGRGGPFFDRRRLTQLYNDTKLSYENARTASANAPFENDPDVVSLKKDFQIQQDRLLAWGVYWADKQAESSAAGGKAGQDVEIDKKVDQAGLGDVVASIMESIKSMLEESGRMSHPGRWRESQPVIHSPLGGKLKGAGAIQQRLASIPKAEKKEWKEYEMTTGRTLLEKLTSNIDLLYDLIQEQKPDEDPIIEGKGKEKGLMEGDIKSPTPSSKSKMTVDEVFGSLEANPQQQNNHQDLFKHPLYIDFARLEPMHDPNADTEPPSYEDVRDNAAIQARSIYYFPAMQVHVLVDLVRARGAPNTGVGSNGEDPYRQMYELAGKMSGKGLLTWDGHLKLLGFTLAAASSRFGLVYALPAPNDPTALQQFQTLTTSIAATLEHDMSLPPLENKVRLAYNIALTATGFLAQNECHGQIKSSNIVFLRENDNPRLGHALRCPYLLQPVQKLVGESSVNQPLSASLYHHPDADEVGYGMVPAHDIYSVGLVLLEIGLWRPLAYFWKEKYDRALFAERLRKLYTPKLASKCGSRYMKLVQKCLDAPDALQDKSSPIDAAEYLLSVVEDMAKCCALDEQGPPSELDIDVFEALIEEQRLANPEQEKSNVPTPGPAPSQEAIQQPHPVPLKKESISSKAKQKPADQLRKWPELDIPQDHLETWNNMLMPRLSKILQNALKDSMESCSVSLMMIGSTPEKAKTTICVQCRNTSRVRETLCQRFKPKRGWGLVVCPGEVRRSGQVRRQWDKGVKRSGAGTASSTTSRPRKTREQHYQPRPGCGASIGAFKDEQHLPPVSFGGTILVDGEPFGMTVHHMLDVPSDSENEDDLNNDEDVEMAPIARRSTAPRASARMTEIEADLRFMRSEDDLPSGLDDLEISDDSDGDDSDGDSDSDASTIRPDYAIMDEEGNEFFFLDDDSEGSAPDLDEDFSDDEDEIDETGSVGDKPGIAPFSLDDDEELCITQPAIDDVDEDFFPSVEDRDDDHLTSHIFGLVHASSGIKRLVKNELKHEIDWALIKVNEERLSLTAATASMLGGATPARKSSSTSSKLLSRQKKIHTEPTLTSVTPLLALPRLHVTSIGRTSGLKRGRISQAMSSVKFHGRTSFSQSFTIEGGFGVPGDSGAWVFSEERNELCGHVLAWGSGLKCAFMAPMEIIFEDLKATLEAEEIRLPHSPATMKNSTVIAPSTTADVKPAQNIVTITKIGSRPTSALGNDIVETPPKMQSRPGSSLNQAKEPTSPSRTTCVVDKANAKDLETALRNMRLDNRQERKNSITSEHTSQSQREERSPSRPSSSAGGQQQPQGAQSQQRSKDIYDVRRTAPPLTRAIPS